MQIIQPLDLESGFRTFTFREKHHLVISTKLYFPLTGGDPLLFSDAYKALAELHTPIIDEGLPKLSPEFLVCGNAQSPYGESVTALSVSAKLGSNEKSLHVIGDRYWMGGLTGTSDPIPFTEMPLIWQNAFGGKDFDQNVYGKGIHKEKTDLGEDLILMPNIEFKSQLLTSPTQRPQPAGFMPLMIDHPVRQKLLGTYDEKWLAQDFPGYPRDLNLKSFNTVYSDQILPSPIDGNEPFILSNMNHNNPSLEGTLPDFKVRAFAIKPFTDLDGLTEWDLNEIQLKIDTVVFYPNQLIGCCIFRGTIEVDHPQAKDIGYLLSAYENKNESIREKSHYLRSLVGRLHPELNLQYALTTKDLIPSTIPCGMARLTQQEDDVEQLLAQHIENRFKTVLDEKTEEAKNKLLVIIQEQKELGKDTSTLEQQLHNLMNPPKDEWQIKFEAIVERLVPTLEDGKTLDLQKIDFRAFDDLTKLSEEYAEFQKQSSLNNLDQQISNALDSNQTDLAGALQTARDKFEQPPILPRPANYEDTLKQISDANEQLPIAQKLDTNGIESKLKQAYEAQIEGYRMGAHMLETGTPPLIDQHNKLHQEALDIITEGGSLAYMDLSGLDFSGMDLRGIDFSDCYLEQCNFHRSNLERANFNQAIAVRCNFSHANLTQASLVNTNIGASDFSHAVLDYANTTGCEYGKSNFSSASLKQIDLSECLNTLEVNFNKADLTAVNFGNATFLEADFSGANLSEVKCIESTFNQCNLSNTTGTQSQFISCNIIETSVKNCVFTKSDFTNSRFLNKTSLNQSAFRECIFSDVSARDISLENTQLKVCTVNQSDFSDSIMKYSDFDGSYCLNSLFIGTNLQHANLSNCNLMGSNLMQADLTQSKITKSNLYGCEFLGAIVGKTDFSGSNLDATKLENWRPSKWQ